MEDTAFSIVGKPLQVTMIGMNARMKRLSAISLRAMKPQMTPVGWMKASITLAPMQATPSSTHRSMTRHPQPISPPKIFMLGCNYRHMDSIISKNDPRAPVIPWAEEGATENQTRNDNFVCQNGKILCS